MIFILFHFSQHYDPNVKLVWRNIKNDVKNKRQNTKGNNTSRITVEEFDDENDLDQSTPTMVFSVIGESDNLVPRPWPKTVFQMALIEAAKSGGGKTFGKG